MAIDPRDLQKSRPTRGAALAPLAGSPTERMQRLQVGLSGIAFMVLLVALADIVITRAQQTEASAVIEAVPSAPGASADGQRDPLVDAGVMPELPPDEASSGPAAAPAQVTGDVPPPAPLAPLE